MKHQPTTTVPGTGGTMVKKTQSLLHGTYSLVGANKQVNKQKCSFPNHDRCYEDSRTWEWLEVERAIMLQWSRQTSEQSALMLGPEP